MSIKEIIDIERWELVGGFDTEVKRHNASLDRIEDAVTAYVAELKEQECDIIDNKVYKAECEKSWSRIAELVMERANIKDIINRERCTILPRNQHARSILVAHNAALDRIEAIILSMYLVETCDWCGKKFVKLPDHPHKDGSARCPHCMADGVDVRQQRIAESPPVAGSETEPEPDFTGRVAELEAALKLAMDWLEDDVPKHIVDKLINSLR